MYIVLVSLTSCRSSKSAVFSRTSTFADFFRTHHLRSRNRVHTVPATNQRRTANRTLDPPPAAVLVHRSTSSRERAQHTIKHVRPPTIEYKYAPATEYTQFPQQIKGAPPIGHSIRLPRSRMIIRSIASRSYVWPHSRFLTGSLNSACEGDCSGTMRSRPFFEHFFERGGDQRSISSRT